MHVTYTTMTTGEVAAFFDVPNWKVRRLYERGLLPEPRRVGSYRVIHHTDLPEIERALRGAGYLPEAGTEATS